MRLRTLPSVILLAATSAMAAATSSVALADPEGQALRPAPTAKDRAEAAKLKAVGDEAMTNLRYAEALSAYTRAYELGGEPALLYNKGRALEALSRYPEALDHLLAFKEEAPPALKAKVPALDELIEDMRAKITTLRISCQVDGARVVVNDKIVGTLPPARPLRVNAGTAVVQVEAEGYYPFRKALKLPGGGEIRLDATLEPKGVAPPTTPGADTGPSAPIFERWWFWAGIGAVVVSGAVLTGALLTEGSASRGDIEPGQVSAPIRF